MATKQIMIIVEEIKFIDLSNQHMFQKAKGLKDGGEGEVIGVETWILKKKDTIRVLTSSKYQKKDSVGKFERHS